MTMRVSRYRSRATKWLDIAIVGSAKEPEVDQLAACLAKLHHPPLIIDTSEFPQLRRLSFADGCWWYEKNNLRDTKVFFIRSLHCSELMERLEASEQRPQGMGIAALREKDSILGSLLRWSTEQNKHTLNPLDTLLCHYYKLDTIERLRQAGVSVPQTIATNDPDAVQEFATNHKHIVCKTLAGGALVIGLAADRISEQFYALLKIAPVMLQARIYGHDIRAYVLNNQVIAAASKQTEHVDFRANEQSFQPTALTRKEAIAVIQTTQLMSLSFAGIDLKRTQDGQYFILDVNPVPMFTGFEQITGLGVTSAIAKYLIKISLSKPSFS